MIFLYVAIFNVTSNNVLAINLSTPSANTLSNGAEYEATASSGNKAAGLAIDASGTIWVTDGSTIATITGNGTDPISSVSTYTASSGSIDGGKLAFGPDGNLYIADNGASAIKELNISTGAITTYIATSVAPNSLAFTPEPSSLCLLLIGTGAELRRRRRPYPK